MSNYQANIITKNPATPTGPVQTGSAPGMWRMDEVSYWLKQGVWPTQGVTGADPYFPYVTLLLSTTSLGNANNNLFVDSSGAFNPISRSGNTRQGSATPYSANWSNYFGSSDYLQISGPATGTGTWTVEGWFYFTSLPGGTIFAQGTADTASCWFLYLTSSGGLNFYSNGNISASSSGVVAANTWVHIALVSNSSNSTTYVNGTSVATGSYAGKTFTGGPFQLNRGYGGATNGNPCYQSNVRMVVGTAVYTSNFTPPTSALTAISGTSLLTCQSNRFRDASTNNYTVASTGSVTVTDFAPFSPGNPGITYNQSDIANWSNYFDGNGDYLTVPSSSAFNYGTGDFTIECWGYRGSSANFWCGYSASGVSFTLFSYSGASSTIQVYSNGFYDSGINPGYNTWFHVAVTRSSGTLRIFINGVQGFSGSYTTDISSHAVRIGSSTANEWGLGNVSNLRVVKGTALYTSNFTPPTTNLTAVSGTSLLTCQSAAFTDNSTNNFVITPTGEVTVTGNSPFNTVGYWSNYFDGSGDYLSVADNAALQFGTGNFTVECWFNSNVTTGTTHSTIIGKWGANFNTTGDWALRSRFSNSNQAAVTLRYASGWYDITTGVSINDGAWHHLAFVRENSTTLRVYVDGVLRATQTISASDIVGSSATLGIGGPVTSATGEGAITGYVSNARLVKGTAVYTSAFTPPTTPLTAITNTSLLTCQNGRFIDNSTNNFTITRNGDVSAQSFDPFYTATIASNGGSMYSDGSGDYLTLPSSPLLAMGTSDFTWECWLYPLALGTLNTFWRNNVTNGAQIGMDDTGQWGIAAANTAWIVRSSTIPTLRMWNHVAVSRSGSNLSLFLNGVRVATTASGGTNFATGSATIFAEAGGSYNFNAYMSDVRIVKGSAVYNPTSSTYTVPTAPLTPTANTTLLVNGMNAGIYDATAINDMETVSGAQVVTNISKFGGSSAFFNGTGGFLDIPAASSKDSAFGTGDFTVEMWLYFNSVSGSPTIITFNNFGSGDGFFLNVESSAIGVRADGSTPIRASTTVTTGVWYHVAVTRSSGTLRLFQDGVNVGSTTWTTNCTAGLLRIGQPKDTTGATYALSGYMDDLRVTKGYARYTSNFTPPTQAFPTF